MGAPTKSNSRKSSTFTGELAQIMLSAWNMRTCLAGARDSQKNGLVRKDETLWLVLSLVSGGKRLIRMHDSLMARWKGADVERTAVEEVKRTMGQVGPRTE